VSSVTTVSTVTTAGRQYADRTTGSATDPRTFRPRLLDGLAASIAAHGYRNTTVADIVRRARTSRRTFYEHFSSKEACFVALLTDTTEEMIGQISAAVDPSASWSTQVRQAVEAWVASAQSAPAITVSWIRDVPSLGDTSRDLQRGVMESLVTMIQTLCDTDEWRAVGAAPVPRQLAIILLGGLRELIATTVEDAGQVSDITEVAVRASIALLGPRT
jgi:AcrR family transcriptional regulator